MQREKITGIGSFIESGNGDRKALNNRINLTE